jgi:hypothetical protein
MPVLPNHIPGEGVYFAVRSGLVALLSLAIALAVAQGRTDGRRELSIGQCQTASVALAALIVFVMAFLISPSAFTQMSLEDRPVEWTSALLPLIGSALLLWCGVMACLDVVGRKAVPWLGLVLLFCAVVLFVLGMEEISWMQRVFGYATPKSFDTNIQHEFNFHNFATNQIGILHKIVGFGVLIYLPFIFERAPRRIRALPLAVLVPGRGVALASAPLAALNYNGWDFLPLQMTTYLTVAILAVFALSAWRARELGETVLALAMTAVIIAAQFLFLVQGDRFIRIWDITEYKELYIAAGLFLWAIEVFERLRVRGGVVAHRVQPRHA